MSWIKKSDDSFKSTNKLIAESLYNTSVHCSYYSCIQMALHIINNKIGMSIADIDAGTNSKGSHNWVIGIITQSLQSSKRREARKFNDSIQELKRQRVIADYKEEQILHLKAQELRQLSYELNIFLKTSF